MIRVVAVVIVAALLLSGCMTWRPGWENRPIQSPGLMNGGPPLSRAAADAALAEAREAMAIRKAIAGYAATLEYSPDDAALLDDLADAHILCGAAWARSAREKAVWYRAGIRPRIVPPTCCNDMPSARYSWVALYGPPTLDQVPT
jgi:hypothetical protein